MRLLIILFLLLNLTVSKAADVLPTYVRSATAIDGGGQPIGIELNPDGTKVFFARFASGASLYQYTLTTPFDISTIDTSTEVTLKLNAGSDDLDSNDATFVTGLAHNYNCNIIAPIAIVATTNIAMNGDSVSGRCGSPGDTAPAGEPNGEDRPVSRAGVVGGDSANSR